MTTLFARQKWTLIFFSIFLAVSLGACGKKNKKESIDRSRGAGTQQSAENAENQEQAQDDQQQQEQQEQAGPQASEAESSAAPAGSAAETLEDQIRVVRAGSGASEADGEEEASIEDAPDLRVESSSVRPGEIVVNGQPVGQGQAHVTPVAPEMIDPRVNNPALQGQGQAGGVWADPIITGAADLRERYFTDGKDDVVMARLIARMNEQIALHDEQFFNDSIELATRLSNVDVSANIHNRSVEVKVEFIDGDDQVRVNFRGQLDYYNRTPLQQVVGAEDLGYRFNGYLTCIDSNRIECKNTILVIEHVVNGEICKRIMVVHRFGDARFTIADEDYVGFSGFINDGHRRFMEYLANTAHFNRYLHSCVYTNNNVLVQAQGDGTCASLQSETPGLGFNGRIPRARVLGYRTWAAAYGAAYFNIFFREAQRGSDPIDVLHIYGPLLTSSAGPAYDRSLQVEGYLTTPSGVVMRNTGQTIGEGIQSATLLSNDGRGNLDLSFTFHGSPLSTAYVDFRETLGQTDDPVSFHLYPDQPLNDQPVPVNSEVTPEEEVQEDVPPEEMGS